MDATTRRLVRSRADGRCEYCQAQAVDGTVYTFQIEHVIPKQHGGSDDEDNLAIACPHCNLHKGPNLAGLDPFDRRLTPLFHPRNQHWDEHFAKRGPLIIGLTAIGRTTVQVLNMNSRLQVELRVALDTEQT